MDWSGKMVTVNVLCSSGVRLALLSFRKRLEVKHAKRGGSLPAKGPQHIRMPPTRNAGVLCTTLSEVIQGPGDDGVGDDEMNPYDKICGFYKLNDKERDTFAGFVAALTKAIRWIFLLGTLKMGYTLWCLSDRGVPVSITDVFLLLESYGMAGVLLMGREGFLELSENKEGQSDIPIILEGMNRLGISFLQIAAYCGAVTLLQAMRAAARCPDITMFLSKILLGVTALRCLCLFFLVKSYRPGSGKLAKLVGAMQRGDAVQKGYSPLVRFSVRIAASNLLGYTFMSSEPATDSEEYEFSELEENVIRMCIDSMRVASLAMLAEVTSYILLGICAIVEKSPSDILDVGIDLIDSSFLCGVIFTTSNYFDRVISSQGQDITQLTLGFGEQGMTKLFGRFARLMKGLFIAGLVTTFVTNGPLGVYKEKAIQLLRQAVDHFMKASI